MISTGSMAPCLLGYHRHVVCPSCSYAFSCGFPAEGDSSQLAARGSSGDIDIGVIPGLRTVCPNCGLSSIDTQMVPRNEGDQLLVHKHHFQWRPPQRWEVVVFRHPEEPHQAYVKRVVGLPGEAIELRDGDVYANGQLQRKPMNVQRGMRIDVFDQRCDPHDPQWRPRWVPAAGWQRLDDAYVLSARDVSDPAWLTYRHWIRSGGTHLTEVPLSAWPADLSPAESRDLHLDYHPERARLSCRGVLPEEVVQPLSRSTDDAAFQRALRQLSEESHVAPISDDYGYNQSDGVDGTCPVHDLMLSLRLVPLSEAGRGSLHLQMSDGWHSFACVLDLRTREARLTVDGGTTPLRRGPLPQQLVEHGGLVEMSLFDRQVCLAVDEDEVFPALPYQAEPHERSLLRRPVRIGAAGGDVRIEALRLYRDVHYTSRSAYGREAGSAVVGPDEFYVLGDNSPVSVDSRLWETPTIPGKLLIGKPFVVHLPSRQGRIEWGEHAKYIRIPDFSRVRYIR